MSQSSKLTRITMKQFLSASFTILINSCMVFATKESGPVGPITINEIKHCDPDVNKIEYDIKLNEESDGTKNLDLTLKLVLVEDYGEELKAEMIIDRYAHGEWQEDIYDAKVSFLEFMNERFPKLLKNICNALSPKVEDTMFLSAGEYTLTQYTEDYHNIEQDNIIYGRLRLTVSFSKDDEELACFVVEVQSDEP